MQEICTWCFGSMGNHLPMCYCRWPTNVILAPPQGVSSYQTLITVAGRNFLDFVLLTPLVNEHQGDNFPLGLTKSGRMGMSLGFRSGRTPTGGRGLAHP